MARHLNINCDITSDFFVCDIPRDAIQVVLKIRTKWGKHTLTEDCERRTEKCTQHIKIGPMKRVEPIFLRNAHDSGSSSDSGSWVQVAGGLEFTPKIFNDPKNTCSDKENNPMNASQIMLTLNDLNITDGTGPEGLPKRPPNFVGQYCRMCMLKWHRCLSISELDWEDTVTQQMPRTSSPFPDDSDKNLEKLETETYEDLDEIDDRARPASDRRKPILRCRPTPRRSPPNWLKIDCPTPQTSPEYITMVVSLQQTKQPTNEVRGILPERRKTPNGWPKCLRKTPLKLVPRNNDLYNTQKIENHHYEEPEDKDSRVFFNMQNNMQKEDEMNENYESVEIRETMV